MNEGTEKGRACGACDVCCFALGVKPIAKEPFCRCSHQVTGGGCGIYAERPEPCRLYRCAWLEGFGEERDRPDRLGVVFDRMAPAADAQERAAAGDAAAIAVVRRAEQLARAREARRGAFEEKRPRRLLKALHGAGMTVQLVPFMGRRLPVGRAI